MVVRFNIFYYQNLFNLVLDWCQVFVGVGMLCVNDKIFVEVCEELSQCGYCMSIMFGFIVNLVMIYVDFEM